MTCEGSHILEISYGCTYLDRGPGTGLTLLAHDNLCELLLTLLNAFCHLQQIAGTFDGWSLCPSLLSSTGCIQSTVYIFNGSFWLTGDNLLG